MIRDIHFNGSAGNTVRLEESEDLFIVRTREHIPALNLLSLWPELQNILPLITPFDAFPESSVWLYQIHHEQPAEVRRLIKDLVRAKSDPLIRFIGSVWVFAGSDMYQVYTGNLFIKFANDAGGQHMQDFLELHTLQKKMTLGFATNAFFVEAAEMVGRDIFTLSEALLQEELVTYCHPELVARRKSVFKNELPALPVSDEQNNNWIRQMVGLEEAWQYSTGTGVKICVIDDGLDFLHPAFATPEKIAAYRDMLDKQGMRKPLHQFEEKHGTACAGVACSADTRAPGVAPDAQIIPIRSMGLGSVLESEAIYWAVQQGADIFSCSWGPPDGDFTRKEKATFTYPLPDHTRLALEYATTKGRDGKGCAVFFAAGNGDEDIRHDGYASSPLVLSVGAVNKQGKKARYSDFGDALFCCFPSGDFELGPDGWKQTSGVLVPDRLGADGYDPGDLYTMFAGTSASCPGAAGVAALALSLKPEMRLKDLKELLKNACVPPGEHQHDTRSHHPSFGFGLLRADLAVRQITEQKKYNMNTTATGYSLHIGIDNVDPAYYQNDVPALSGCVNDMRSMQELAAGYGYQTTTLVNSEATREAILAYLKDMAFKTEPGDILLITYAGHGAPIPDTDENGSVKDETDGFDESWVTYSGFLLDDELYAAYAGFKEGVRILVVSDSCHSGTMLRAMISSSWMETMEAERGVRLRYVPLESVRKILARQGGMRSVRSAEMKVAVPEDVKASLKLLAACQDNQYAQEKNGQGLFTVTLLDTLKQTAGNITTYSALMERVISNMPPYQEPRLTNEGMASPAFDAQLPFSIAGEQKEPVAPVAAKPVPVKRSEDVNLLVEDTDTYILGQQIQDETGRNKVLSVVDGEVNGHELSGKTAWDKAYLLALANADDPIGFVEPDMDSDIGSHPVEEVLERGGDSIAEKYDRLKTYPPARDDKTVPFDWHLGNAYSQLKAAREEVFPELLTGDKRSKNKKYVKIAHIDTGFLDGHPAHPEYLDRMHSASFAGWGAGTGGQDTDMKIAPGEQQGHGNATLAILAGGKLRSEQTDGLFSGYFGAIPFADVISIKISESVVLLSGKRFAKAIDHAIDQGVDVITMSMSGWPTKKMARAINRAYENGIVVVCAGSNSWVKQAGFTSHLPDTLLYPARYERTIAAVGATYTHVPYVYALHNRQVRAEGGKYMQMSYGPESAMKTAIAGYTPNVPWFSHMNDRSFPHYYTLNGGGTSSATPQVAAAAALYIQKYRTELDQIAGKDKWKIVEIVKAALFRSAKLDPQYRKYYGNGILKAKDALAISPASVVQHIKLSPEASANRSFVGNLISMYFRAGNKQVQEDLKEMMEMELVQLCHRIPALHQLLLKEQDDVITDQEKAEVLEVLRSSDLASDFLKANLAGNSGANRSLISLGEVSNVEWLLDGHRYFLRSSGVQYRVKKEPFISYTEADSQTRIDTMEIEVGAVTRSGSTELVLLDNQDELGRQTVVLMETEVDGRTTYEWLFRDEGSADGKKDRSLTASVMPEGLNIPLHTSATGFRGNGKVLKAVLHVISWASAGKKKKEWRKWLSSTHTDKYGIMLYDLEQDDPSGRAWVNSTLADQSVWKTIQDDQRPVLCLVPGTFREVQENYDEFLSNAAVRSALRQKSCRYVIGLNHPSVVDGIAHNAGELDKLLKGKLKKKECTVIAKSRGGLVARYLFEKEWVTASGAATANAPLRLRNLVMLGTPNQGTHMASNTKWKNMINVITNVAGKAFSLGSPLFKGLQVLASAVVNEITDLPGLDDMEIKGDFLRNMNKQLGVKNNYFIVTANYEPDPLLRKFFDNVFIDQVIFERMENDAVVPVRSVFFAMSSVQDVVPDSNRRIFGSDPSLNHFAYTRPEHPELVNWIMQQAFS